MPTTRRRHSSPKRRHTENHSRDKDNASTDALDDIPDGFEAGHKPEKEEDDYTPRRRYNSEELAKKRTIYWSLIVSFSSILVILWVINAKTIVKDVLKNGTPEIAIIDKAQNDAEKIWQELYDSIETTSSTASTSTNNENAVDTLRGSLENLFASPNTSTTSSTEIVTPTSTPDTTDQENDTTSTTDSTNADKETAFPNSSNR